MSRTSTLIPFNTSVLSKIDLLLSSKDERVLEILILFFGLRTDKANDFTFKLIDGLINKIEAEERK